MPKLALSDTGIRSFPIPEHGQVDYWDKSLPGFGLRVSQGGSKTFILNVRDSRRAIGRFPIVSLADARTEARRQLAEKTLGKFRPRSIAYDAAVEAFLDEKKARRRERTVKDHKRHLGKLGFKGQLGEITHDDLARKLKGLKRSEFNHRVASAKTFFRWALAKRFITETPVLGFSPHPSTSRSRVLSDQELKSIWLACSADSLSAEDDKLPLAFVTIVKLLVLTGQRRGEIAALKPAYFDEAMAAAAAGTTCSLPPTLTKNGRPHTIPIGLLARQLLPGQFGSSPNYLFPARGSAGEKPFNGWSKSKRLLDKRSGVNGWTLHDLRRTFATRLAEKGVAPHIIERLLNHVTGSLSPIALVYNKAKYLEEMRQAIALWESHLGKLLQSA